MRATDVRAQFADQARICFTTFPCTSVRRKSRPWNLKVSCVWSMPSRCRIVAFRSWTSTGSLDDVVGEVVGLAVGVMPGLMPPPASQIVKQRGWWSRP